MPKGSAVVGVTTLAACKASCVASDSDDTKPFCDGVLFDSQGTKCYRKASVDVARCAPDNNFNLFLRTEANRPPAAPRPDYSDTYLTSAKCSQYMRDPNHKFFSIWGSRGWTPRRHGQRACFDDNVWGQPWFDWVAGGKNCEQRTHGFAMADCLDRHHKAFLSFLPLPPLSPSSLPLGFVSHCVCTWQLGAAI